MSGWHPAYESSSGHPPASASGGFAASDEQPENLFGADADDWAFLRDEESLPYSEAKFKDALIFLIDCSALMQFPANEDDLDDESSNRIKVKPEASSIDSASGHHAASHETSSGGAAAASSSAGSSDGARRPAAAAASSRDPSAPQMTQFQMVLSVVLHSIRNKIISTPDDFVGLVFFGSRESQNPNGFPHIYIHTPLQNLTAGAIRKMDALMDQDEFDAMIGSLTEDQVLKGGKVEMDKILWICSSMFTEAAAANCHKRIIVLTNNDTPFNTQDRQSKMRAIQKGKDLRDLDIAIDLIAVAKKPDEVTGSPKVFNPLLFFSDIYIFDSDESPDQLAAVFRSKMSDLKEQLFKKSMKKRSLGSVPLQLGAGVQLGVKLYCMIRETKKESAVYLDSETNEKLDVQTRFLDASTGAVLQTHEMQKYYPYGGAKVFFSDDELKAMKNVGEPGLVLMGFKPYDAIKVYMNYRSSYFIHPDDGQFSDSSKAFKALLLAMHELKQVAICRLIYRKGSIPRFVALFPQMARVDPDSGEVLQYPGMNLVFLPYADDIRKLRFDPTPIATDNLIDDAKKVVAKLTIKKIPHIPNPALQKHYRVIQAIALEEQPPGPDEVEDLLMPDVEGIQKYANLIDTFVGDARQLGEAALAEIEPAARKRKADGEEGGAKKLRKEDQDYSEFDWKQMLENDTLKKLTIPDLKVYLRHHKLPLAGTKEKLLDRVTSSIFTDS